MIKLRDRDWEDFSFHAYEWDTEQEIVVLN